MNIDTVFIASDHAGFSIKDKLIATLRQNDIKVTDCGPNCTDRVDYPDYADRVCSSLKTDNNELGVLICGSGQGMAMRANKYPHIRAALCWNTESAKLSRQHNNANLLCVGSRLLEEQTIIEILKTFINEEFEGGRHQNRVDKISSPLL